MFIKVLQKLYENEKLVGKAPNLVNTDKITNIAIVEKTEAEVYFQPIGIDKKGEILYDFMIIEIIDPQSFVDKFEKLGLIVKI